MQQLRTANDIFLIELPQNSGTLMPIFFFICHSFFVTIFFLPLKRKLKVIIIPFSYEKGKGINSVVGYCPSYPNCSQCQLTLLNITGLMELNH